jgi:hypothetical protein
MIHTPADPSVYRQGVVRFRVGDRVEKWTGAYTTFGEVRCAYTTKRGDVRYVVEVEPQGFQMIWSERELRHATDDAPRSG